MTPSGQSVPRIVISFEDDDLRPGVSHLAADLFRERMKLGGLLRILDLSQSVGELGDERRLAVFGQFVFFGGNDKDVALDFGPALVKIAHQFALAPDPISLLRAGSIIRVVEARQSQCRAKITGSRPFDLFRRRAAFDDLSQQFPPAERRISVSQFHQSQIRMVPFVVHQ